MSSCWGQGDRREYLLRVSGKVCFPAQRERQEEKILPHPPSHLFLAFDVIGMPGAWQNKLEDIKWKHGPAKIQKTLDLCYRHEAAGPTPANAYGYISYYVRKICLSHKQVRADSYLSRMWGKGRRNVKQSKNETAQHCAKEATAKQNAYLKPGPNGMLKFLCNAKMLTNFIF